MINNEQRNPPARATSSDSFQGRVQPWMMACFGAEIAADGAERNHRFLEESLELVQASACTASEAHQLVDYVYGRPVGERAQEVGGVMVTLAALCLAQGLDMHAAGETELARIWTKVEAIRAKQAAKPKHSPLPVAAPQPIIGRLMDQISALPVLWGLNEPGALLRNSDVFRVLVAAGREQAAPAAAPVQAQEPVAWRYQPKDGLGHPAYTERYAQALAYDAAPVPLYRAPAQPVGGPEGLALVPIDATCAMINAASAAEEDGYDAMHKAMLAAAPAIPAAPAAQGNAKPEALLYAALNMQGRIVYSHESFENVDMNRRYIKTPTTIVGLAAIDAKAAS